MNAVERITAELRRFGALATHQNPSGICIYDDVDAFGTPLPTGWVRLSDGTGEAVGHADHIAAALEETKATGEVRDDGTDMDWEAVWETLGCYAEHVARD